MRTSERAAEHLRNIRRHLMTQHAALEAQKRRKRGTFTDREWRGHSLIRKRSQVRVLDRHRKMPAIA
jgi:hypothetical protein